jgi:UDP-3-O-[3-hydroxymyristoyl] N-acetylglucosamine deacetylase
MSHLVLIVDDEPGILETLAGILHDEGFETLTTTSGDEALDLYRDRGPDVVFLDIWLPDRDGLETLQAIKEIDPAAAVIMMSGHGTSATAVKSIKMGAHDYLEKPLSYDAAVGAVRDALAAKKAQADAGATSILELGLQRLDTEHSFTPPAGLSILTETETPQRTIAKATVIYGLGLHSGGRTGMVLQPLPVDSGIHFLTLPAGTHIPAHLSQVAHTDYATTLTSGADAIRTVEHLLSALHASGITNLLVKVHGEIPVLDGSALEFCRHFQTVGIENQERPRREVVIDRTWTIEHEDKRLVLEPHDGFAVSYLLDYPAPIGEQLVSFEMTDLETYMAEVAPARTFGFMRDLKMINELGLGSGGRLDNFILVGEDNVLNTELRFPDEFARHKILDIVGDLYLLGYPMRGKVTAELTGHRDNINIQRQILADCPE